MKRSLDVEKMAEDQENLDKQDLEDGKCSLLIRRYRLPSCYFSQFPLAGTHGLFCRLPDLVRESCVSPSLLKSRTHSSIMFLVRDGPKVGRLSYFPRYDSSRPKDAISGTGRFTLISRTAVGLQD